MRYYIKKIVSLIMVLFLVILLTFLAFQVIPGDGALAKLGVDATEEAIEALRESLGLNKSIPARFVDYFKGILHGDFGISYQYDQPVAELVAARMPATLGLALISILLIVVVSLPLGLLCSKKENGTVDNIITLLTQTLMAVPAFFLGILITLIFGLTLRWFMPGRYVAPAEDFGAFLRYMIFPATAIAVPKIAMLVKFLKTSVIRELKLDYVRTARSKGNTDRAVLWKHVLKNALIPVITFMGMVIADVLAGSIVIEQVFNLPGLGRLLVVAIGNRDYPVVQAIVIYIASVVLIINFIVDLLYQKVDPRIRLQ
ncbi:MAG: ABC transporter permease [Lachnospiraceae bacterium]|nr:ABC transporter permease [Lachnospiraceae bacterium]